MQSKFSVKVGLFELSCEGDVDFYNDTFPRILQNVKDTYLDLELTVPPTSVSDNGTASESDPPPAAGMPLSVSTVCAKLKVDSGPSLVMAACFSLQRRGKGSCSRRELMDEMKAATSYFKASYISNLSASLKNLVGSGKLLEQAKDVFAIDASTLSSMESQLGLA